MMSYSFLRRLRWPYVTGEKETQARPKAQPPEDADRLYLDIFLRRADEQASQIDALDSKSSTVFAVASTVLPVTLGIYSINTDQLSDAPVFVVMFILASVVIYLASAASFVAGYWPTPFETQPALRQWASIYGEEQRQSPDKIQAWLANAIGDSIDSNRKMIGRKIKLAKWSIALLFMEVLLLVLIVLSPLM